MRILQANNATAGVQTGKGKASRGPRQQARQPGHWQGHCRSCVCGHAADSCAACFCSSCQIAIKRMTPPCQGGKQSSHLPKRHAVQPHKSWLERLPLQVRGSGRASVAPAGSPCRCKPAGWPPAEPAPERWTVPATSAGQATGGQSAQARVCCPSPRVQHL